LDVSPVENVNKMFSL